MCIGDLNLVVPLESDCGKNSLSYIEVPLKVLNQQVCKLRNKSLIEESISWGATWGAEADIMAKYPDLFTPSIEST